MLKQFFIFSFLVVFLCINAQEGKHIVKQDFTVDFFKKNISEPEEWIPYPTIRNAEAWKSLLPSKEYAALILKAESLRGYEWPLSRASVFRDYVENGNRSNFESITFSRRNALAALVVGELIENEGRFMSDIIDGVWLICEETFWGVPAHLNYQKKGYGLPDVSDPIVDLFAAETASMLAWVSYLIGDELDKVNPLIKERIHLEIDRRIIKVVESDPQYRWMGYGENVKDSRLTYKQKSFLQRRPNNWNPWISSNILTCILLLEKDKQRRAEFVFQVFDILDNYLEPYPADGGCDEGTGYWARAAASTFDCFDLVNMATNKKFDLFNEPLIRNMGEFISKAYIGKGYYINFADAVSKTNHSPMLVYRYGKAVNSQMMMQMGAYLASQNNFEIDMSQGASLLRIMPELYYSKELLKTEPLEPLVQDSWFPDIQMMVSRDNEASTKGLFLAAKAGHNEESHNHNDVGSFMVFNNGNPVIIDVGAATYAKNYSSSWVKKSEFHNLLPVIDGENQQKGKKYSASKVRYSKSSAEVIFTQDFAKAYDDKAGVIKWQRIFTHRKGKSIIISDSYELKNPGSKIMLPMILTSLPDISKKGEVTIKTGDGEKLTISYEPNQFDIEMEEIKLEDKKITLNWGDTIYRVLYKMKNPAKKGKYRFVIK